MEYVILFCIMYTIIIKAFTKTQFLDVTYSRVDLHRAAPLVAQKTKESSELVR